MENTNSEDKEKIRIMPPVIFFLCLVMGLLLQWLYPLNIFPSVSNLRLPIALPIVFIAGITAAIARRTLNINNAGLLPGDKSNKLITKGIFSISRNPMYLSLVIFLLGLAFLINSYYLLIMIPFFIPIMQYGVIIKEERLLTTDFGNEYKQYQGKVRRWI